MDIIEFCIKHFQVNNPLRNANFLKFLSDIFLNFDFSNLQPADIPVDFLPQCDGCDPLF